MRRVPRSQGAVRVCACSTTNSMGAAAEGGVPAEVPRALFAHGGAALGGRGAASAACVSRASVSYTHLTLPTKRIV